MTLPPSRCCPVCTALHYAQVPSNHVHRMGHWFCRQHDPRPNDPPDHIWPTLGERAAAWVRRCFGEGAMARKERAARLMEEAVELAQAEGVEVSLAQKIVERAYARPAGDPEQEAGGVGMCLAAWAEASKVDVAMQALREVARVESFSVEHFQKRHAAKVAAGSAAPVAPILPGIPCCADCGHTLGSHPYSGSCDSCGCARYRESRSEP